MFPVPLTAVGPDGALVHSGTYADAITAAGEVDSFQLTLESGMALTLLVEPSAGLQPKLQLSGPGVSETVEASVSGGKVVIHGEPIITAGTYTFTVSGLGGSSGAYSIRALLNAEFENEGVGGTGNDTSASAENIQFLSLGSGASRAAVTGSLPATGTSADWYRLNATAGESLSIVADSLAGAGIGLEIKDAAGTTLAQGVLGTEAGDLAVRNFIAPATGDLFLRISGAIGGEYVLAVTRGAQFDTGQNDSIATAQHLGGTTSVLGGLDQRWLGRLFAYDPADKLIREVDPATGTILRSFALPFALSFTDEDIGMATSPTTLLVGGPTGSPIYELNPDTGATIRTIATPSIAISGMAFLNGEIFALTDTPADTITVFDYTTGAVKRTITASSSISGRLAASENALYGVYFSTVFRIDPFSGATTQTTFPSFVAAADGLGVIGNEIFGTSSSSILVSTLSPAGAARTIPGPASSTGLGADGGKTDADFFRISAGAGATLTLRTTTPAAGAGETRNLVDPIVDVYDSTGALVASDDNGAGDGRNAALSFVATAAGEYTVRVRAASLTHGEYLLSVGGAQAATPAFVVSTVTPQDGSRFATAPTSFRLDFNDALSLPSVQASDLTINGQPATAVTVIDGNTLEFTIADPGPGTHNVAIAAGAIADVQGTPLAAFTSTFTVDNVAPRVVSTSVQEGAMLPAGSLTVTIGFNEAMNKANLSAGDVILKGTLRNATYTAASLAFDATGTQLSAIYTGLPEDNYTLTLLSADGAFEDLVGRNLDGEPVAFPIPSNQSGNGTEGGNFSVNFTLDITSAPLPAFHPVTPAGSFAYDRVFTAAITSAGDVDAYTFTLGAGESIAFVVDPTTSLHPAVTLRDSAGAVVASAVATSPGEQAVLQAITAPAAGTYTLVIEGAGQTQGLATVRGVLNAFLEPEGQEEATNNSPAAATDLDVRLNPLPGGGARGAVFGRMESIPGSLETEPNGSTGQANVGSANFTPAPANLFQLSLKGVLGSSTDVDYFKIGTLEAGDVITISQAGVGGGRGTLPDGRLGLYRGSSTSPVLVFSDENSGPGNDPFGFRYTIPANDTYYIAALGAGPGGSYDLAVWLENIGAAPQTNGTFVTEVELNGSASTANDASASWRPVQYLARTNASINASGDMDYLRFEFTAGDLVTVNLDSTSGADMQAVLLDAAGTIVAREDGSSSGPGADSAIYAFRIPATGTYYVRASSSSGSGAYTAEVYLSSETPPPGLQIPQDFYAITLKAGEKASFVASTVTGSPIRLELRDAGGTIYAVGATAADQSTAVRDFMAPAAGKYYVRITGDPGAEYHLLALRNADLDSGNNDTLGTAQPLSQTGSVLGHGGPVSLNRLFAYDSVARLIREVDPETGSILRSFPSPAAMATTPDGVRHLGLATTGSTLLVGGSSTTVFELNPDTGSVIRTIPLRSAFITGITGMAFMDGEIYVQGSSTFQNLQVFDYTTGESKRLVSPSFLPTGTLAAGNGVLFSVDESDRLYQIDLTASGSADLIATLPGIGIARGLGVVGNELFVADGSEIEVFSLPDFAPKRTLTNFSGLQAIGGDSGSLRDNDFFQIHAAAGATLTIATATPGSGLGAASNNFDPFLQLFDTAGQLVASDNNSGLDGRNAALTYVVPASGIYTINVKGVGRAAGEYLLQVSGAESVASTFAVASVSPTSGAVLSTAPTFLRVDFNHAVLLPSLQASDVTIDGVPVTAFKVVDGDTVDFTLPAGLSAGKHSVNIAAGALTDVSGTALEAYSSTFVIDSSAPRVTSINVQQGDSFLPGTLTVTVGFSEPIKTSNITASDITLQGAVRGQSYTPANLTFNPAGDVLTFTYSALPEDNYTLKLLSGTSSFMDLAGLLLDGETTAWPIPGNQSGNGTAGGDFVVGFAVDNPTFPMPGFAPISPFGGFIQGSSSFHIIGNSTDTDSVTLTLEAGQSLTVAVRPSSSFQPSLALIDSNGNVVGTASAGMSGGDAFLYIPAVSAAGVYKLELSGTEGTSGYATLRAILNANVEQEELGGPSNDLLSGAQNIDALFHSLSQGTSIARISGVIDQFGGRLPAEVEFNNNLSYANPASTNFIPAPGGLFQLSIQGELSSTTDIDYYNLGAMQAGDILSISESGIGALRGALGNGRITLYRGSTGTPVPVIGDLSSGSGGDALIFRAKLPANDTYFIAVWGGGSKLGTYDLAAFLENVDAAPQTGGTVVAESEDNNTAATANDVSKSWQPVQYLSRITGSATGSDVDVYSFQFAAGDLVTIDITPASSNRFRVALLDANGTVVAQDDGSGYTASYDRVIHAFRIPAGGIYSVRVDPRPFSLGGSYTADVYLSSETPPPSPQPSDDVYAVTLGGGERVSFVVGEPDGRNLQIALHDSNGALLAYGMKGGGSYSAVIPQFTAPVAGTYFVKVTGDSGAAYQLAALRNGAFDSGENDSLATAQGLISGDIVAGYAGPAVLGRLYVHDSIANVISQLNPETGSVIRSFPAPKVGNSGDFGLATTGQTLLTSGGNEKLIYELNPDTGAVLRKIATPEGDARGLAFANDEIFVLTGVGNVTVLDYSTGAVKRSFDAAGVYFGLASTKGALLGTGPSGEIYEIDPVNGKTTLRGVLSGTFPNGIGVIGDELFISGSSSVKVVQYPSLEVVKTLTGFNGLRAVGADAGGATDRDFFQLQAKAGSTIVLSTATPGGASVNALDPAIDIYDSAGTLLASNDNGAADGRNAALSFIAPADGSYYVEVRAVNGTRGEYLLQMNGGQTTVPPFAATTTTLDDGAVLRSAPGTLRVNFNRLLAPESIQASDLTVDGAPATAFTLIDGNTIEFTLPDGLPAARHQVSIAAGAVTDVAGTLITAYTSGFDIDVVPPRIVGVSIAEGGSAQAGKLVYVVEFSEPMNTTLLDSSDIVLQSQLHSGTYVAESVSYDASGKILTVTWNNLPDDAYTLALRSAAGGFEDRVGLLLDGELNGIVTALQTTGNGLPGGDFITHFTLDATTSVPITPVIKGLPGSLLASASVSTLLAPGGDIDTFTVELEAGETLALTVDPASTLIPAVRVLGPQGNLFAALQATSADETIYIPAITVLSSGTYTISISGADNSTGDASIRIVRNGVQEMESNNGPANDTLAAAQDLSSSFVDLGGNIRRVEVTGTAGNDDWYRLELNANEWATILLNDSDLLASHLGTFEMTDASGVVLVSAQPGFFADRAVHGFRAPVTGEYYIHIQGGSGGYHLLTSLNADIQDGGLTSVAQSLGEIPAVAGTLKSSDGLFVFDRYIKEILRIDPQTGHTFSSFFSPVSASSDAALASTGSTLLVAALPSSPILEIDAKTGAVLREIANLATDVSGLAFGHGEIFVLTDATGGEITVLDYTTGVVKRTIAADVSLAESLAASPTHLYGTRGSTVYQIDPVTGFTTELVTVPKSPSSTAKIEGLGVFDGKLYIGMTSRLWAYDLGTGELKPLPGSFTDIEGISGDAPQPDGQLFSVNVPSLGSKLHLSTLTPGGARNTLNPRIELLDPTGAVVAADANSAADGINAQLTYTPTVTGTYTVRILAESGEGEYLLNVTGASTVNDAPILSGTGNPSLPVLVEDQPSVSSVRVADLLGLNTATPRVIDVDVDALAGIAITGADTIHGTWEFSLDGNTWVSFGTPSETSARLLTPESLVRFKPLPDFHGTAELSYRAWDQTTGTNGSVADVSSHGGMTAFSAGVQTATVTVLPVNDRPALAGGQNVTVVKDSGPQTLSGWASGISAGAQNEAAQQLSFRITTDRPELFAEQPSFAADGTLSFRPAADATGVAQVILVLQDDGGTENGGSDTLTHTFTISIDPALISPGAQITREDVPITFSSANGNRVAVHDFGTGAADMQVTVSAVQGSLTLGTIAGLTFTTGDGQADSTMSFSGTAAAINAALEGLVFVPTAEFAGQAAVSITVQDMASESDSPLNASATVPVQVTPVIEFTGSTTYTDANGDLVKVVLKGGGRGEIWLPDLGSHDALAIVLEGTSARSTLSIVTPRGTETVIGNLIVHGSLKSITASSTDLTGSLDVAGSLRSLVLDNVAAGSSLRIHTDTAKPLGRKDSVTLKFDRVTDASLSTNGLPISSLTATDWLNTNEVRETIVAPSIGKLKITGSRKLGIAGDFGASLSLTGAAKSVQVAGDATGDIDALSIGALQVGGDFANAQVKLAQTVDPKRATVLAVGSLKVGGVLDSTVIETAGRIGAITLGGMRNSRIFAGVSGDSASLPDETTDFTTASSIKSFDVLGREPEFASSQVAASSIGRISLSGIVGENGGTAFGVAADKIAALVLKHGGTTTRQQKLSNAGTPVEVDDFVVRVV